MQGIAIPAESVDPEEFFAKTRRHISPEKTVAYGGGGTMSVIELRKADILSSITLRFVGKVKVVGGTTNSTAAWPLGIAGVRFTANGQSNLINTGPASASGGGLQHLRARDFMKKSDLTDRGVEQTIAGAVRKHGTLALASETWGVPSQGTGIAAGTYDVDLTFPIPVSEDERDLVGAIFLQTATSDLTLTIDETPVSQLFTGGTATSVTIEGSWQVLDHEVLDPGRRLRSDRRPEPVAVPLDHRVPRRDRGRQRGERTPHHRPGRREAAAPRVRAASSPVPASPPSRCR